MSPDGGWSLFTTTECGDRVAVRCRRGGCWQRRTRRWSDRTGDALVVPVRALNGLAEGGSAVEVRGARRSDSAPDLLYWASLICRGAESSAVVEKGICNCVVGGLGTAVAAGISSYMPELTEIDDLTG